jgi:hypothetical protein
MNAPFKPPPIPAAPPQELREIVTKDGAGRKISTFEGRPRGWLSQFACNPKRVVSIKTR